MEKLLTIFAKNDKSGMAKRLFTEYLKKQRRVIYFDDAALNVAADQHDNITYWCGAALSAPNTKYHDSKKARIHQALKQANWDIKKMVAPTDLGVPAFNKGSKIRRTEDYANGLGLMIGGVQYVFVVATHYHYDKGEKKYCISLRYRFYDVFGLDDDDLEEFGATRGGWDIPDAAIGITAWWQLQHQHGYAPLVTRIVLEKTHEVPAI
jgi:hypothetical protein